MNRVRLDGILDVVCAKGNVAKTTGNLETHGCRLRGFRQRQRKAFALVVVAEKITMSIARTTNYYASNRQDVKRQKRSRCQIPAVQSAKYGKRQQQQCSLLFS